MVLDVQSMGQRYLQLENAYTGYNNNTATLHVRQLPPNPAILAPGPAFIFVVVKGVPSVGVPVMIGSGKLGKQDILPLGDLPASLVQQAPGGKSSDRNSALGVRGTGSWALWQWVLCASAAALGGFVVGW